MGDQRFMCGRYKDRTFEEVAKNDVDFCEAVLKTAVCSKYYPQDFQSYLLSLRSPSISESKVRDFVEKWDPRMEAEFRKIIGSPHVDTKQVHPRAATLPHSNLGVFIGYFVKKCIFNLQAATATGYNIELFASIFPFKVSKTVPAAKLAVRKLFDAEFYAFVAVHLVHHFEDKCDSAVELVDLFLRNIHDFRRQHFNDDVALRNLQNVVQDAMDPQKSFFAATYVNDYLRQFPRLNQDGVLRYAQLRQMFNSLCAAFGRDQAVGEQRLRLLRVLPEINCYELLSLLEPDFYVEQRAKYIEWFQKYLFFFIYAVESPDNPVFFIDDPLYECLKSYVQYRHSPESPENLKLCLWLMTLVHRRLQPLDFERDGENFQVDDENLKHVRSYVENYPGIESAVVDFAVPTNLLMLGIPIVTKDAVFKLFYSKFLKSSVSDFYEGIVRALMCPLDIKKITIYNAYTGVETSMLVPPVKKEVLQFVRRYNKYDPTRPVPLEYNFTDDLECFFEQRTIQWDEKYSRRRKSNSLPVYDYKDVLGDA